MWATIITFLISLTSTDKSPIVRAGEVIDLTVFPIHCSESALITRTPPTLTHSPTTAVYIRPIWSAVPVWFSMWVLHKRMIWHPCLIGAVLYSTAWRLVVVIAVFRWSTAAATFRVNPDHGGFIVTHRANQHCYIFIFPIVWTRAQANSDVEVRLKLESKLVHNRWYFE